MPTSIVSSNDYRQYPIILWLALLLTGCGIAPRPSGPESHYLLPGVGSSVTVNQEIVVPPGRSRVFIQWGQVVPWRAVDRYIPHCNFEIRELAREGFTIAPGEFRVAEVRRLNEQVVAREAIQLASSGGWGIGGDGSYSHINLGVTMMLISEKQPQVMRLTCYGAESEPSSALQPSIREIEEVLGALASFRAL